LPQASIEFEVADAATVQVGADELKEKGFTLLHDARTAPWDRRSLGFSPARGDHRPLLRTVEAFVGDRRAPGRGGLTGI
jgi:hypothetical protein